MFTDQLADARLIVNDQDLSHNTDTFLNNRLLNQNIIQQE